MRPAIRAASGAAVACWDRGCSSRLLQHISASSSAPPFALTLASHTCHTSAAPLSNSMDRLPQSQQPAQEDMVHTSEATELSPFLFSLLDPPETVALEDATRTYKTMDVVERCALYDPTKPNVKSATAVDDDASWELGDDGGSSSASVSPRPIKAAHEAGKLWQSFVSASEEEVAAGKPPRWFETLCRDLFFRTDSTAAPNADNGTASAVGVVGDNMDEAAALSDPLQERLVEEAASRRLWRRVPSLEAENTTIAPAGPSTEVDPYLWLPFQLFDEKDYIISPYVFSSTSTYSLEQRTKLCLGARHKEYVCFCTSYSFPERAQLPTSLGTQPVCLYVDPACPAPVVYIQLSADVPPAMWLPVKGTAAAVRRVLAEFVQMAALHRDWHHAEFEAKYAIAERVMELQRLPRKSDGDVLRYMAYDSRNTQYMDAPLRQFRNQQEFFLGEYDDPERLIEHLDLCPFFFAIPHLRTVVDLHAEHMTPTIEGPGVAPSLYRCIFSKALVFVNVQLSAEVKLPPQDPEAFHFMWKDSQIVPKMKIPVFARVLWPDNTRMSGGGLLNRRFNALFGTEFASDIPVDAALALFYALSWAKQLNNFMGVHGMRQRVAELEAAARMPDRALLYPSTREIPNPEYSTQERLGMHVQYLSQLGDPHIAETIEHLLPSASAPVRMGCAKAALIAGERELFRRIVSSEPPGRMQLYMTKLVRKRKTRDLVDPEPRLLDEQYEYAAPLWTGRGTRIDRNTLEGAVDATRLRR